MVHRLMTQRRAWLRRMLLKGKSHSVYSGKHTQNTAGSFDANLEKCLKIFPGKDARLNSDYKKYQVPNVITYLNTSISEECCCWGGISCL